MALPVAAIVCIVLACWVLVVLIAFAVYQFLKTRGTCSCECAPCGKEDRGGCCECCITLSDSCNCCNPSVNGCLDKICPGKKKVSCVDLILCQCCAGEGEQSCCLKILPSCKCCDSDCCSSCADCEAVVCCCLEIRLVSMSEPINEKQSKTSGKYTEDRSHTQSHVKQTLKVSVDRDKDDSGESGRPLPVSPPSSARSVSQLVLIPKADLQKGKGVKKQTVRKMATSQSVDLSKPSTGNKRTSDTVKKRVTRRSLPDTPRSVTSGSTVQKSKQETSDSGSSESELEEVAIKHQNIPLHTLSSNHAVRALSQGSLQSGSHVTFSLSEQGNSRSSLGEDYSVTSVDYTLLPSGYNLNGAFNAGGMSQQDFHAAESQTSSQYTPGIQDHLGYLQEPKTSGLNKRPLPVPTAR